MIKLIQSPKLVKAAGNMPKAINEFFGRVNSQTSEISIARMRSPTGWEEPGQTPEFDEYTVDPKAHCGWKQKMMISIYIRTRPSWSAKESG